MGNLEMVYKQTLATEKNLQAIGGRLKKLIKMYQAIKDYDSPMWGWEQINSKWVSIGYDEIRIYFTPNFIKAHRARMGSLWVNVKCKWIMLSFPRIEDIPYIKEVYDYLKNSYFENPKHYDPDYLTGMKEVMTLQSIPRGAK